MSLLEKTTITEEDQKEDETSEEAPYGYKADGTPKKRPGRPKGSSGGTRKGSTFTESDTNKLAERFIEYLGPPIGFASPLALAVLEDRADKTANAFVQLARTRPRIARFVRGMIEGSSSVDIMLTGVGMATAIGVETQRFRPDSMVAHYFHIDQFYVELGYGEFITQNGQSQEERGLMSEIS